KNRRSVFTYSPASSRSRSVPPARRSTKRSVPEPFTPPGRAWATAIGISATKKGTSSLSARRRSKIPESTPTTAIEVLAPPTGVSFTTVRPRFIGVNVLIAGAPGGVGKHITEILAEGDHDATAMVREESQVPEMEDFGVETVVADLTEDVSHAVAGHDAIVFAAGSGGENVEGVDRDGAISMID